MCDYSLHGVPNRLAREGEDLVAHRFSTGAIGLASPSDVCRQQKPTVTQGFWASLKSMFLAPPLPEAPAVCIPPGATLRLMDIPANLQRELSVGQAETVRFTQTTAIAQTFHDAVRFQNGRVVLLQFLKEGQRVRVLSLGDQESEFTPERLGTETPVTPLV